MILVFEVLRFNNRQVGFLQVMHALIEDLGHISAAERSIKAIFVYLIFSHIFNCFCVTQLILNLRGPSQERQASQYLYNKLWYAAIFSRSFES